MLPVGTGRDLPGLAERCRHRQLEDLAGRHVELADLVDVALGEPDVAVGPDRDAVGSARGGQHGELGDHAARRDAAELVADRFGEPQVSVRPGDDRVRTAVGRRDRELGDDLREQRLAEGRGGEEGCEDAGGTDEAAHGVDSWRAVAPRIGVPH
jgi:hypothetical protein